MYSKQDVERARELLRSKSCPEVVVDIGPRRFSYFVMPQFFEKDLPGFVYHVVDPGSGEYVFGIADSVPEWYRKYAVLHEYVESLELEGADRCLKALEEELKAVPLEIKEDYLQSRKRFFRDLLRYAMRRKDQYPEQAVRGFKKTLKRLENLTINI